MLNLSDILYDNLKNPDSRILVFCKSLHHLKYIISEVDLESRFSNCSYNCRDLQMKSDTGASAVFRYGNSCEDISNIRGCSFTSIIIVDYQDIDPTVISILKSRLRTYQDIEVIAYGSNSKEFYGYVKLKMFAPIKLV